MKNLLNSTEIATVFLDGTLRVRRFPEKAAMMIKRITGDMGRPVTDLGSDLLYPELADDARVVLRTLAFVEKEKTTRTSRRFAMRLLPHRTMGNRVDSVVITFTDITVREKTRATLRVQLKGGK